MVTVGSLLSQNRGVGNGFDFLRIALAVAIFYGHAKWIAGSSYGVGAIVREALAGGASMADAIAQYSEWAPANMFKRAYHVALVPMFFSVSGFLVTSSAFRVRSVKTFLAYRMLRIFPALTVEVALSALILGPIFTTMTLSEYFRDPLFLRYFGNIFGFVSMLLPAVFELSPAGAVVNANLWTLPSEFYCYLITAIAMASTLFFNLRAYTAIFGAVTVLLIGLSITSDVGVTYKDVYPPIVAVYYFFAGVFVYHWRDRICLDWRLFIVSCLIGGIFLSLRRAVFLAPIFITYATIYVGMLNIPKIPLLSRGDYSYGIYLYGFPICQALIISVPALHGHHNVLAILGGMLTLLFAVFSWHRMEKPILRLKGRFVGRTTSKQPAVTIQT